MLDITGIRQIVDERDRAILDKLKERFEQRGYSHSGINLFQDTPFSPRGMFPDGIVDHSFSVDGTLRQRVASGYGYFVLMSCYSKNRSNNKVPEIDLEALKLIYGRISETGLYVCQFKIESYPELLKIADPTEIREKLHSQRREDDVLGNVHRYLSAHGLNRRKKAVKDLFGDMMRLTLDTEVDYFFHIRSKKPCEEEANEKVTKMSFPNVRTLEL